jgi:glycosyltransferase involved in cell wall biosynthesis
MADSPVWPSNVHECLAPAAPRRPLRIAMMLESDEPGGAEMMVYQLSNELRSRGHTILPVGPARGVGWLGDLFRKGGFHPEVFRISRPIDPSCVRGLVRLFRDFRIDAVHSHEFTMAVYGTAATRLLGLPHIITMHGGLKVCKVLRRRIALRWAMRASDYSVMVSRATQKQFSDDLGVKPSLFTVVPNGVPVRYGDPNAVRKEFDIAPHECVILAVGVLERHKGHQVLLDALARLKTRKPELCWRLIIAGGAGGEEHSSLLRYITEHGLSGRVHIVLNRNDVADLLSLSDIFVMPSRWEGLPMAVLEAMVARKAIIASAIAGIPEALVNGREGLLVPPGEPAALADALEILLTQPHRRQELADAAAERAKKEFTAGVMADRYEALYARAYARRDRSLPQRFGVAG